MKLRKPKKAEAEPATTTAPAAVAEPEPHVTPNPPRTTTGWLTSPKFGSAGSGGAELEPGPELD